MTFDKIGKKAEEAWEMLPQIVKDAGHKATFILAYSTGYIQCLEDKGESVEKV